MRFNTIWLSLLLSLLRLLNHFPQRLRRAFQCRMLLFAERQLQHLFHALSPQDDWLAQADFQIFIVDTDRSNVPLIEQNGFANAGGHTADTELRRAFAVDQRRRFLPRLFGYALTVERLCRRVLVQWYSGNGGAGPSGLDRVVNFVAFRSQTF